MLTFLIWAVVNNAQTILTFTDLQPGLLKTKLSAEEIKTVTDLNLEGNLDARDFRFIRDSLKKITNLNLFKIKIAGYSGNEGTENNWYNSYPPNELPKSAFKNCSSLQSIIFPDSVVSIGIGAFSNSYNLTTVTLNSYLREIGNGAFRLCHSLSTVNLSPNIVSIGADAFFSCNNLKGLILPSKLLIIDDGAFCGCENLGEISIPPSVTHIGSNSFWGCTTTKRLFISDSVKYIGKNAFMESGASISVSSGNPFYSDINGVLFNKNQTILLYYPTFRTGNYNVPPTVKTISEGAFYNCKQLTSITTPASTDTIGPNAFAFCSALYKINLPPSVRFIGYNAFMFCGLNSFVLPDSLTAIYENTFLECQGIKSISIPEAVLHIGMNAFYHCISLKSVLFQNSKDTTISEYAFAYCNSLQSFVIPGTVKTIGIAAFYGNSSMSSITIPASVSNINDLAFGACSKLNTIYAYPEIPVALPSEKVFSGVNKDSCRLLVPNQSLDLYKSAPVWKDFIRVESIVTSIKNIENPDELIIYPNPATDILNIKAKEGLALIYDSKGQLKISRELKDDNSINISSLPPGFYVVLVNGASYKVLKK